MCTGRGSNQGPLGRKSDALTTAPLCHLSVITSAAELGKCFRCNVYFAVRLRSEMNVISNLLPGSYIGTDGATSLHFRNMMIIPNVSIKT